MQSSEFIKASDMHYYTFLKTLHERRYNTYFEIGSRTGESISLSNSPSVGIDPYFSLTHCPITNKEFCLLFQESADDFFAKSIQKFSALQCELAFIDGMHFFEFALRDFINLSKIASHKPLFLFHDCMPFSFEMTTRDFKSIAMGMPWTGDIWKLIPILIDEGFFKHLNVLDCADTGMLTIFNPDQKIISALETNLDKIIKKWTDITLEDFGLSKFYDYQIFKKPDQYLNFLKSENFGEILIENKKKWISH